MKCKKKKKIIAESIDFPRCLWRTICNSILIDYTTRINRIECHAFALLTAHSNAIHWPI